MQGILGLRTSCSAIVRSPGLLVCVAAKEHYCDHGAGEGGGTGAGGQGFIWSRGVGCCLELKLR